MSDEVQKLLKAFRARPIAVEPSEHAEARLHRIVPNLDVFTHKLLAKRRIRHRGVRATLLAAAMVMGLGIGAFLTRSSVRVPGEMESLSPLRITGEVTHTNGSGERSVLSGDVELTLVGQVETHLVGARIATQEGLRLELAPETHAVLGRLGQETENQRVNLSKGKVTCRVPPLGEDRAFSVATPDAIVVVHGTTLSVEVEEGREGEASTCVRVTEGLVSVHRGNEIALVSAGGQNGCRHTEETASLEGAPGDVIAAPEEERAQSATPRAAREATASNRSGSTAEAPGTLADETRLLQGALRAENEGRAADAQRLLEQLLQDYPRSPLAADARIALRRIRPH